MSHVCLTVAEVDVAGAANGLAGYEVVPLALSQDNSAQCPMHRPPHPAVVAKRIWLFTLSFIFFQIARQ